MGPIRSPADYLIPSLPPNVKDCGRNSIERRRDDSRSCVTLLLNQLTAKYAKCSARVVIVLSFLAFVPRYHASYWHYMQRMPPLIITADRWCYISDMVDRKWSMQPGWSQPFKVPRGKTGISVLVSILLGLSSERCVYAVFCIDRERYLRSIYCIVRWEVSRTEIREQANLYMTWQWQNDLAMANLHDLWTAAAHDD